MCKQDKTLPKNSTDCKVNQPVHLITQQHDVRAECIQHSNNLRPYNLHSFRWFEFSATPNAPSNKTAPPAIDPPPHSLLPPPAKKQVTFKICEDYKFCMRYRSRFFRKKSLPINKISISRLVFLFCFEDTQCTPSSLFTDHKRAS